MKSNKWIAILVIFLFIASIPLPVMASSEGAEDRPPIIVGGEITDVDFNDFTWTGTSPVTLDTKLLGTITFDGTENNAKLVQDEAKDVLFMEATTNSINTWKSAINRTERIGMQTSVKFNNTTARRALFDMKSMNPPEGTPAWPILITFDTTGQIKDSKNNVVGNYEADVWYDIVVDLDSPNRQYSFWINGELKGDKIDLGNWVGPTQNKIVQFTQASQTASMKIAAMKAGEILEQVNLSSIAITPLVSELHVNEKASLTVEKTPANSYENSFLWESNDASIVAVDQAGEITGVAEGTAVITVSSIINPAVTASITITVKAIAPARPPVLIQADLVNIDFNDFTWAGTSPITLDTKLLGTITFDGTENNAKLVQDEAKDVLLMEATTNGINSWKSAINHTERIGIQTSVKFNSTTARRALFDMKSMNPPEGTPAWPVLITFDPTGQIKDSKNSVVGNYEADVWYDIVVDLDSPNRQYSFWINGELKGDKIDLGNWVGPTQNKIVQFTQANQTASMKIANIQAGEIVEPLEAIIANSPIHVAKGKALHLTYETIPAKAFIENVNWFSSNPHVAKLYGNGLVALNEGVADITITETLSGVSETFQVIVGEPELTWESQNIGDNIRYILNAAIMQEADYTYEQLHSVEIQKYMDMNELDLLEEMEKESSKLTTPDTFTKFEEISRKMAQIYTLTGNEEYAKRVAFILYHLAQDFPRIAVNQNYGYLFSGMYVMPQHAIYAYNLILDANVWNTVDPMVSEAEIKRVIEELWFRPAAYEAARHMNSRRLNNIDPYGIRQGIVTASVLNDPYVMREYIKLIDTLFLGEYYYADGMWEEGTIDYGDQVSGNINRGLIVLKEWSDPVGYVDHELGLQLDKTDISDRWPLLQLTTNFHDILKYPDGTKVAVHDTHYRSGDPMPLPIQADALSNIELFSYGYYGLVRGDLAEATHAGLLYQPLFSGLQGGHTHANYLALTLWGAGVEVLPDSGYIFDLNYADGSGKTFRYPGMRPVFHNMPWIWREDGSNTISTNKWQKPALLAYDDGVQNNKVVQLIEASEPGPDDIEANINRRLLMVIELAGSRSYTFDLSRLQGGQAHEIYQRGTELEDVLVQIEGVELTDTGTANLAEYLNDKGVAFGISDDSSYLFNPKIGSGSENFNFTWTGKTTGTAIRTFMNGVENSELILAQMPQTRRVTTKADEKKYTTPHLTRRNFVAEDEITKYMAVHETYRDGQASIINNVEWFESEDRDQMTGIAVVNSDKYRDIIYTSNDMVERSFEDIIFAGQIAMVRMDRATGKILHTYVYGQGKVETDNWDLLGDMQGVYEIESTTTASTNLDRDPSSRANTILVKGVVSNQEAMIGQWLQTKFADRSGYGLKVKSFEEVGDATLITVEQYIPFSVTDAGVQLDFVPNILIPGNSYVMLNVPKFKKLTGADGPSSSFPAYIGARDSDGSKGPQLVAINQESEFSYSEDELIIQIPAGSTEQDWELTVKADIDINGLMTDELLLSKVFELTNNIDGSFFQPLTLSFRFDPAQLSKDQIAAVFHYNEQFDKWEEISGAVSGNYITVSVDYLGKFAVMMAIDVATTEDSTSSDYNFLDIAGHWAEIAIQNALKAGIVSGYLDGSFKPDQTITRAEFTVMLVNFLRLTGAAATLTFEDRDQIGDWAEQVIALAVHNGIINGYPNNTFQPNAVISRAEMVVMLTRALEIPVDGRQATNFADDEQMPIWAKAAIVTAEQQGWIKGRGNNRFVPLGSLTRAEAVHVLQNLRVMDQSASANDTSPARSIEKNV